MAATLRPKNHLEAIALFRAQLLGPLLTRDLRRGELQEELDRLAQLRVRPPNSPHTRTFAVPSLRRWLTAYRREGLSGLEPRGRGRGNALGLADDVRALLVDIRREHPHAAVPTIIETLESLGRLSKGQVSQATVRRLYREHGLKRARRRDVACDDQQRRRWEAEAVGDLWHADVCHGASIKIHGTRTPVRVHAILDDKSRYIVALRVLSHEREVAMLDLTLEAIRRWGRPRSLYLDNGSTYSGDTLRVACGRLGVTLMHAKPHDARARGKMERFWRTMREGCLDLMPDVTSLHDVQVRLLAWVRERYHARPHSSLAGHSPEQAWATRVLRHVTENDLSDALIVMERRRVRGDGTLTVGGVDWELQARHLLGKVVDVGRTLADGQNPPWVVHDGQRYTLTLVDPVANGKLRRRATPRIKPGVDAIEFNPTAVTLRRMLSGGRRGGGQ